VDPPEKASPKAMLFSFLLHFLLSWQKVMKSDGVYGDKETVDTAHK